MANGDRQEVLAIEIEAPVKRAEGHHEPQPAAAQQSPGRQVPGKRAYAGRVQLQVIEALAQHHEDGVLIAGAEEPPAAGAQQPGAGHGKKGASAWHTQARLARRWSAAHSDRALTVRV